MLLVLAAATGCTAVVNGSVRPAPGLSPRPLTGRSVQQVLLDPAELSRVFGQSFAADPNSPPESGPGALHVNVFSPPECGGVANVLIKDSYAGSDVRDVAGERWWNSAPDEQHPPVISVHEAVVALPSARAADARFAALAKQWRGCNGRSTTIGGDVNFTFKISHVQEKDSLVAANVDDASTYMTVPGARAVGVRVNCIIEVEVVFFSRRTDDGARHTPSAADVARLMMDRVSSLS
ncbi:sensor domain-containing protein [Mycobacterium sp.]|uniref:sensor domain-containing protein n=1 Tax=Mycobacterium sp. TaxID=1785 RepID=UPI002BEF7FA2|nr:sensor domain-containing protein [Mycobacterium sp.]HTQ16287.1 sensor domain-containing protein [Mycobacterium sp.]